MNPQVTRRDKLVEMRNQLRATTKMARAYRSEVLRLRSELACIERNTVDTWAKGCASRALRTTSAPRGSDD